LQDTQDTSMLVGGPKVLAGSYKDMKADDIVVITCGAAQLPNETRLDLFAKNAKIIRSVVGSIVAEASGVPMILMVTNPVDALTTIAVKEFSLDKTRCFGSGTLLDSMRQERILAYEYNRELEPGTTFILGEHGD